MLKRVGKTEADFAKNTKMGKIFRRQGVRQSSELDRIVNIPRRKWEDRANLALELTDWLKTPQGTMQLRPVQAAALADAHDFGGLLAPQRVGAGKTILSLLVAEVLDAERPLLIIPAKLKRKTEIDIAQLKQHWRFKRPKIVTYEWLGRVQAAPMEDDKGNVLKPGFLDKLNPDLIVGDEIHKLKNLRAAVTRRVGRYMEAHPETKFIGMSGTITKRSLRDYAHLAEWALGKIAPVPLSWPILSEWADCLDEDIDATNRLAAGALIQLCNDEEKKALKNEDPVSVIRRAYRRRLVETPGVVATVETFVDCSLTIAAVDPGTSDEIDAAFDTLRGWETPDGWPISDPATVWRHARELACNFYYKWDPRPPEGWIDARKEWCAAVRKIITYSKIDSELQVAQAIAQGRIEDPKAEDVEGTVYANWTAVRNTFKPNTVPVWIDNKCLRFCADWMEKHTGLVWVEHVAFGLKLSEMTGRPYYHRQGLDAQNRLIDQSKPEDGSVIASIAANCEGRNLQAWNQNLMVSLQSSGSGFEQFLGRTHRDGQKADEVSVDMIVSCIEQWAGFQQAVNDARYIQDSTGQLQKLLYADLDVPDEREVAQLPGPRWNK